LHPTDAELMRDAGRGDEAACRELVDRHAPNLYRLAYSLVNNACDAEDVLQETFAGAFGQAGRFQERSAVKTWLSQILVRQAAKCHRSRKRHSMTHLDWASESTRWRPVGKPPGCAQTQSDTRVDVLAVLQTLPPAHREIVVLREMQGMSYEEIAAVLEVPCGTVESRLFRARLELKERLKDYLP